MNARIFSMHRWLEQNVDAVAVSQRNMEYIRQVRTMYYDHGLSAPEIARKLKISEADAAGYLEYDKCRLALEDLEAESQMPTADNDINIGGIL